MATRGSEITGPLQRSRSNNYYNPPVQTSYEPNFYVDDKLGYQTQTAAVPPLNTRRNPTVTAAAPLPPLPIPPPPRLEDASMVTIPAEMFDRMFLRAQDQAKADNAVGGAAAAPAHHRHFANPTPLSIVGFLLALSPLSCDLMGWRGRFSLKSHRSSRDTCLRLPFVE